MKMIILGWPNDKAAGPATVIAGPEVPISDQHKTMAIIKGQKAYPSGIVRVEHCYLQASNIGIYIEPKAATAVDGPQASERAETKKSKHPKK